MSFHVFPEPAVAQTSKRKANESPEVKQPKKRMMEDDDPPSPIPLAQETLEPERDPLTTNDESVFATDKHQRKRDQQREKRAAASAEAASTPGPGADQRRGPPGPASYIWEIAAATTSLYVTWRPCGAQRRLCIF